ncbi:Protein of unknown function [Nitrosomonas cryotolerans]|uniref:DUF2490 domain-containing protein n=1 Tax=Nitrosomonas cryotolerans ATCC 49181 TaxID=1131553 RepID=A0A1N6FAN9_9PROT|nr:DUF2490 domain-containing protein [Nitrosomonas cryotolerans]SFP74991.1 Protein of unknown function [Nitrosomonas cryotolerans]SIN92348.1 Protein of unknown function [Nitrosomonas cryotolerans ATCC 49181]
MLKKLNIFIVSAIISLIPSSLAFADEKTVNDFMTWSGTTITGDLSFIDPNNPHLKKIKVMLLAQGRWGDDTSRFTQALIRPGIGYAFNKYVTAMIGYDWLPTQRPFAGNRPFNEHRLWQQLEIKDTFSFGTLSARTRFEQQFFDIPGVKDVGQRFREKLKLSIPLSFVSPKLNLVVWDEVFVNMVDTDSGIRQGFNQNWAFGGFGYKFTDVIYGELGYQNQIINRPDSPRPDQMDHILAINVNFNF